MLIRENRGRSLGVTRLVRKEEYRGITKGNEVLNPSVNTQENKIASSGIIQREN